MLLNNNHHFCHFVVLDILGHLLYPGVCCLKQPLETGRCVDSTPKSRCMYPDSSSSFEAGSFPTRMERQLLAWDMLCPCAQKMLAGFVFTRFETTSAYICFITDTSSVSYAGQLMPRLQIRKCLSVCMWEVQRGAGGQAVSWRLGECLTPGLVKSRLERSIELLPSS